jgi:hypothetical protein
MISFSTFEDMSLCSCHKHLEKKGFLPSQKSKLKSSRMKIQLIPRTDHRVLFRSNASGSWFSKACFLGIPAPFRHSILDLFAQVSKTGEIECRISPGEQA